jgi:hypothetical protein
LPLVLIGKLELSYLSCVAQPAATPQMLNVSFFSPVLFDDIFIIVLPNENLHWDRLTVE